MTVCACPKAPKFARCLASVLYHGILGEKLMLIARALPTARFLSGSRRYTCQLFCKTEKLCSQTSKRHMTLTQHTCPFGRHGATSLWLSCLKINDCKKKPKHSVVNWKADWPLHPFDSGAREVGASTRPRSSYHFRYLPCVCAACDKRDTFFCCAIFTIQRHRTLNV